ncbi:hypothetical protein K3495_g4062 [Podosphaera aphanis]|nr:hypothetical protein K3495_g4062 [Podosphaera aphanis]
MDAFVVSKKRRKSCSPSPERTPSTLSNENISSDEESTDYKLAILASSFPRLEQSTLLDVLLAHDGSVLQASSSLAYSASRKVVSTSIGHQGSLSTFVVATSTSPKPSKQLCQKGRTLHLYSPKDIEAHTPCTIIHNFLPAQEADNLLLELLEEAKTFGKTTFRLFDNIVQSPHTSCFYVESSEEVRRQKTEYFYQGEALSDVRQLTPRMIHVSPIVATTVNAEITRRIKVHNNGCKLRYQSPNSWKPNAAFVNCYNGPSENVGYHSDQLTYLGPRAIIGSLSLGVAREFRVRKILPPEPGPTRKMKQNSDDEGQIAIHLPHNSLLIMHAGMQEEWKHCVSPVAAIDLHPISGNKRINITYRDYKSNFHPRFTPRCHCRIPTVLRVVQRKTENRGRYFWACHAGSVPGKDDCGFFQWAEFDDDGEPLWKSGSVSGENSEVNVLDEKR